MALSYTKKWKIFLKNKKKKYLEKYKKKIGKKEAQIFLARRKIRIWHLNDKKTKDAALLNFNWFFQNQKQKVSSWYLIHYMIQK